MLAWAYLSRKFGSKRGQSPLKVKRGFFLRLAAMALAVALPLLALHEPT